jgi:sarcosine oxidase delta subunit
MSINRLNDERRFFGRAKTGRAAHREKNANSVKRISHNFFVRQQKSTSSLNSAPHSELNDIYFIVIRTTLSSTFFGCASIGNQTPTRKLHFCGRLTSST